MKLHAAAGLLLTAATPAHAAGLCEALGKIVVAGFERPAFRSISGAPRNGDPRNLVPSVALQGFKTCTIDPQRAQYSCFSLGLAPAETEAMADAVRAGIEPCTGKMVREDLLPGVRRWVARGDQPGTPVVTLESGAGQVALTVEMP